MEGHLGFFLLAVCLCVCSLMFNVAKDFFDFVLSRFEEIRIRQRYGSKQLEPSEEMIFIRRLMTWM